MSRVQQDDAKRPGFPGGAPAEDAVSAKTSEAPDGQAVARGGGASTKVADPDARTIVHRTMRAKGLKPAAPVGAAPDTHEHETHATMTAFVESCVETVADSAVAAQRRSRGRPTFRRLLRVLQDKTNILVTTHLHPDPDALASSLALSTLLGSQLPKAHVTMSVKGRVGGGINEAFVKLSNLKLARWDDEKLGEYDAIILLDCQPNFAYSPLPPGMEPTAVIDHHRSRGRKPHCPFCDVRTDVGATGSIIFSYYMEIEQPIFPDLGATLLYAIESDLAGAAGQPGELDNIALSSLTLIANTRKLYQMRYVDLPQGYYTCTASGLANAYYYDNAIFSHVDAIDGLEKPAVIADFLLRFDQVQWSLVTAVYESRLMLSLRTSSKTLSAADMIRKLLRNCGEGGGHRTKAGGFIPLETCSPTEVERFRTLIRRRYLRALGIKQVQGKRLIPRDPTPSDK